MTGKRPPFGLTPQMRAEPWHTFAPAYMPQGDASGLLAYHGLVERACEGGGCVYELNLGGAFGGSFEDARAALWPADYVVVQQNFRGEFRFGQDRQDRRTTHLIGVNRDGSVDLHFDWDEEPFAVNVMLRTSDGVLYWRLRAWCEENLEPVENQGVVRCLSRPRPTDGYRLITLGRFETTYDPMNYAAGVVKQFDELVADLNSDTPRGRMAIIHGPPGTGKTYLLKAITRACEGALVIFVPNALVADLGNPELIQLFTEYRSHPAQRIVLLAEDADVIFRRRSAENTNAISSALNLTDGMFGELLRVYIVGTTNVRMDEIDEAIRRPGRLSQSIHVGALDPGRVAAVFRRLREDEAAIVPPELAGGATLAEVYAAAGVYAKSPPKRRAKVEHFAAKYQDVPVGPPVTRRRFG